MKARHSVAILLLLCVWLTGCVKTQHITNKDLDGVWYSTLPSSGTITFNLTEKTYSSSDSFGSGNFHLQKGSSTLILEDSFGDTYILIAKQSEDGAWVLTYESPYFPLSFARTQPSIEHDTEDGTDKPSGSKLDELTILGETILSLLNEGEWICADEGTQIAFNGNSFSLNGDSFETFLFASVQIEGQTFHFNATYSGGEMVGRLTQAYSSEYQTVPDIFHLELFLNGEQYIRASLQIPANANFK